MLAISANDANDANDANSPKTSNGKWRTTSFKRHYDKHLPQSQQQQRAAAEAAATGQQQFAPFLAKATL